MDVANKELETVGFPVVTFKVGGPSPDDIPHAKEVEEGFLFKFGGLVNWKGERSDMKAVRVHEFGLDVPMRLDEVPDAQAGPGELLVRLGAAGLNPSDVATRVARHQQAGSMGLPYIPGLEASGEVIGWGEGVKGFAMGQRVFGRTTGGCYAELVRMDAATAAELPAVYSYEEGAGITLPFRTAWNALVIKAEVSPGETVLVHGGAGGVGMAAIQIARRVGCRVLATVSSKEKAEFCKSLGAEETINYKEEDFASRCVELTGGRGVDVVVDIAASENFDKELNAIAVNGRIVLIGAGKNPKAEFRVPALMTKDARVFGITGKNLVPRMPEFVRRLVPMLREGSLRIHVDRAMSFEEANEAHELLRTRHFLGKLVLVA